jgi:uncharacterized protein YraI
MKRPVLNFLVAVAALMGASVSGAQQFATTTGYLNLRAGPHPDFPVVSVIPRATSVVLYGCLSDFFWCDVSYGPERGWVYSAYLSFPYQGQPVVIADYGPVIGLQILTFSVATYWGAYYANRAWYHNRVRYHNWHYYPSPRPPGPGPGRPPGVGPGHPPGRPSAGPPRPPGYRPPSAGQPPGRPPGGAQPPGRPPGGAQRPPGGRPPQATPMPSRPGNPQSRGGSR